MASAALRAAASGRSSSPPPSEMSDLKRRKLHETLLDADTVEDLPGEWQAAIIKAE
jgi:hypothetical protein